MGQLNQLENNKSMITTPEDQQYYESVHKTLIDQLNDLLTAEVQSYYFIFVQIKINSYKEALYSSQEVYFTF